MTAVRFPTLQFATNVAYLAGATAPGIAGNRATFEGARLLSGIAELARQAVLESGADLRTDVRVAMTGSDGRGEVYRLGWTDEPGHPVPVEDDDFPFGRMPSAEGRLLMVTIGGDEPLAAEIKVERYEHGKLHGYVQGSPAIATCTAAAALDGTGASSVCYAFNDGDVSGAVERPLASVGDFYEGRGLYGRGKIPDADAAHRSVLFSGLLPEKDHEYAIELVRRAEARGEAVSVSTSNYPGLHLVREPGAAAYGIRDSDEARALASDWAACGLAHVAVRHCYGSQLDECSVIRKVGGILEGPDTDCPGACQSRRPHAGGPDAETHVFYYEGGRCTGVARGAHLVADEASEETGPRM